MATYNLDGFIDTPDEQKARAAALAAEQERVKRAKAAAAASNKAKQQKQQKQQQQRETPQQASQSAQAVNRDEGFITRIGNAANYLFEGDYLHDGLNAVAAGINAITPDNFPTKGFTQGLDDNVRSAGELDAIEQRRQQQIQQGGNPLEKGIATANNALTGIAEGAEAGVALPMTIAARMLNQDATWARPPAVLKNSAVGQTIFEISQVLVPTLLTGGVAAGYGAPALTSGGIGLLGESAVETAPQDSADDLIAGRFLATKMGELADHLGYNGGQLTRDLIEGKKVDAQVFVAAAGLIQNLGINWGADKLFRAITSKLGTPDVKLEGEATTARTAQVLGKKEADVVKALDDTKTPDYNNLYEPHEVEGIDSAVPVGNPSKGKTFISDEALVQESLRKAGIGEDGLTAADRKYFTNWGAISDSTGVQRALQEATQTLKRLKDYPDDLKGALGRAQDWWNENRFLVDNNLDAAVLNFSQEMVEPLKSKQGVVALLDGRIPVDKLLREYTNVSEEGYVAAALMGEELGIRIQKLARQAMNLEAADQIDFTKTIENLLDLHDKANLFLIPLRRGKRKWAVEGSLQQRKSINSIKDADIQGAIKKADPVKYDADPRSFEVQKLTENDTGFTIRELWERYKGGDDAAGDTLKAYLHAIAYSDPKNATAQVENLSSLLYDQLRKGKGDAVANLYYGFMLSRVATQTASATSNIVRIVGEPMGAILSGERAYGLGQLVGGWSHAYDGLKAAAKAFKENRSLIGGSKLDEAMYDLKLRQTKLDEVYAGYKKQMAAEGNKDPAKAFAAAAHYWGQTLANHPITSIGNRFLLAQDEASKVIFASQVATGRAWKEAAELGFKDSKDINRIVNQHFRNVFKDGVATGKIVDADVLDGAKHLTFQSNIPENGNFIDKAFLGIKDATDTSGFWRFFSPFTRVSYNILETAGRYEPTGMFRKLDKRYKAILAGEMGDVAQLQLKSQIALGWTTLTSITALAGFGFTTGFNSGDKPKTSFILPDGKGGYTALPYNKIEPYATIIAVVSDAVNGLRDDVISQGQYDRFMSEMMYSLGMATFDKSFLSGMNNLTAMLDVKNFGEGTAIGLANSAGVVSPALVRMLADWVNPNLTISTDTNDITQTLWAKFKQRTIGGAGLPVMYNEMTGQPISKTAIPPILNEFIWAGRIQSGKDDKVSQMLNTLNFKQDNATSIRTFEGIPLSLEQQSKMSKALHDVGKLHARLEAYFDSPIFKQKYAKYQAFRGDNQLGNQGEGTRSNAYLQDIYQDIRAVRREAKMLAAQQLIQTDPDFAMKYNAAKTMNVPQQAQIPQSWEGLLSWANK
jgi:hypothetical protein